MSSRCLESLHGLLAALLLIGAAATAQATEPEGAPPLRVCADPDNRPLSQADGTGLENRLAALLAAELHRPLETTWHRQHRGFVRKTVGENTCDAWMGVPAGFERLTTTRPYYRSSFVLLTRRDDAAPLAGLDDPRLPALTVGVQVIGDEVAATPAGLALARRGALDHVRGFPLDGLTPAAERMVAALADGRIDAALVWGPQAGWFAQRAAVPIALRVVDAPAGLPVPFRFAIAVGVRRGDTALRDALQGALDRRHAEVQALLDEFAVPRVAAPAQTAEVAR